VTYLCLAAGKGTRFARLGTYLQKCMYPIGVHPFVEYTVASALKSDSFDSKRDDLAFVVGHHAEQLRSYFGDNYASANVSFIEQLEQQGTGHAVDCARRALGFDEVIVWLADLFVPSPFFERIRNHDFGTVLTIAGDDEEENNNVRIDCDDTHVLRAWQGTSDYFDIGLWKFDRAVLDRISDAKTTEYRVLINVQNAIEAGATVGYQIVDEWIHLGGVHPTVPEHVRRVINRMMREETLFDNL
jgi:NDP-sugar pyrophosphorylase family protein